MIKKGKNDQSNHIFRKYQWFYQYLLHHKSKIPKLHSTYTTLYLCYNLHYIRFNLHCVTKVAKNIGIQQNVSEKLSHKTSDTNFTEFIIFKRPK